MPLDPADDLPWDWKFELPLYCLAFVLTLLGFFSRNRFPYWWVLLVPIIFMLAYSFIKKLAQLRATLPRQIPQEGQRHKSIAPEGRKLSKKPE